MDLDEWVHDDVQPDLVPRELYRSARVLELELAHIFARSWHFACVGSELAATGDYVTLTVGDQPVVVVRGRDGEQRAFLDACSHRGTQVTSARRGNCGVVFRCMYHGWAYDLTGKLVSVPYADAFGPAFDRSQLGLVPVRCESFFDLVFVSVDPDSVPLVDYLGELGPRLGPYVDGIEAVGRMSWVFHGNWKLWHENFRDNYHPEFAHPRIHDMMPKLTDRGGNWGLLPGHSILQWFDVPRNEVAYVGALERKSGVRVDPASIRRDNAARHADQLSEVLAVFPNMDLQPQSMLHVDGSSIAGAAKRGFIQVVHPLGVAKSRVDIVVYSDQNDTPEERAHVLSHFSDGQG